MVMSANPNQMNRNHQLAILVGQELHAADAQRFRRISARGLLCGFVELDGVVSSYYLKSLALQLARRVSGVTDVVDMIRVAPLAVDRTVSALMRYQQP